MKFKYSKTTLKIAAICAVFLLFLPTAFQNCSPVTAGFTAVGEIGQDSSYVAPVTRSLKVSPIADKIENDQPIKVLIVVDDSLTMSNSQNNLARSMSKLAELLSNYDAEIMVITTSTEKFIKSTSATPVVVNKVRTNVLERKLNPAQATYKFLKSQTPVQKSAVVTSLSNAIRAVGTAGNQIEKPLFSMAVALDSDTFLKPNDNVLVYVITDEDDSSASLQLASYLKKSTKETQESGYTNDPYDYVPGYVYTRKYYRGTWNELTDNGGGNCGTDDLGNPLPCGGGGSTPQSQEYLTYEDCWADISNQLAARCELQTPSSSDPLNGQTVADLCRRIQDTYPRQIASCGSTQVRIGGPQFIPEKLLREELIYFVDFEKSKKSLQEKIIALMNKKFGGQYLIAAQVNKEGQACTMGQGQSMDKAFKVFENLAPKGRFIRSSICDEAAVSGDVLREIAIQLTVNITNQYAVTLDVSERILTLDAVKGSDRISLAEGTDFTYADNIVRLISLNPTDFDYLDVGVGKKENWKD